MAGEEIAKKIIVQNGECFGVSCDSCIKNEKGEHPCDLAQNMRVANNSIDYEEVKVEFCKQWLKENEMKKKFRLEDYTSKDVCMSFENEEEYNSFCKFLDNKGRKWNNGSKYTEFGNFTDYDSVVLYFNNGTRSQGYMAKRNEDGILKYSDFDWSEKLTLQEYANKHNCFTAQDKDGMRVSYKNKPIRKEDEWEDKITIGEDVIYIDCITDKTLPFKGNWKDSLCKPKKENEIKLEVTTDYKDPKWCEVRDSEDGEWEKAILIADNGIFNLEFPYIAIEHEDKEAFMAGNAVCSVSYKYARPIPKKEYKAYTEPKLEWILNKTKVKSRFTGCVYMIKSIQKDGVILEVVDFISFKKLLDNFTWLDCSICGEEIK